MNVGKMVRVAWKHTWHPLPDGSKYAAIFTEILKLNSACIGENRRSIPSLKPIECSHGLSDKCLAVCRIDLGSVNAFGFRTVGCRS
jgi:hypothetical protein